MTEKTKKAVLSAAEEVLGLPQDEMAENMELDLFENELIDSMGCVAMVTEIADLLKLRLDVEKFQPEDYTSLQTIGDAVERIAR